MFILKETFKNIKLVKTLHVITKLVQNKEACTLKKEQKEPLKYQITIWMQDLKGLTKTTAMEYHRPEKRTT